MRGKVKFREIGYTIMKWARELYEFILKNKLVTFALILCFGTIGLQLFEPLKKLSIVLQIIEPLKNLTFGDSEDIRNIVLSFTAPVGVWLLLKRATIADKTAETARVSAETSSRALELSEQDNIANMFLRAVELLSKENGHGKPDYAIRIGAISTIERIARNHSSYYSQARKLMGQYIQVNASKGPGRGSQEDIVAAFNMISCREPGEDDELHLWDIELRGLSALNVKFIRLTFYSSQIIGCVFSKCRFTLCSFHGCELVCSAINTNYSYVNINNSTELHVKLVGGSWIGCNLVDNRKVTAVSFMGTTISGGSLSGNMNYFNFVKSTMSSVDLTKAEIDKEKPMLLNFSDSIVTDVKISRDSKDIERIILGARPGSNFKYPKPIKAV
jgi:hypothetical protein